MKTLTRGSIVLAAAAVLLAASSAAPGNAQVVPLVPNFQPDPHPIASGTSGGSTSSDCGFIAAAPNQVIQLSEPVPYLRFRVQGSGQPTLLIEGPGGRFCGLAEPEISGFWQAGSYNIYVGDRAQGQHPYTLSVTKTPK